jgi:hypothetical protein
LKFFTVQATHSDKFWVVTVDDQPLVQGKVRRLDQVENMAKAGLIEHGLMQAADKVTLRVIVTRKTAAEK